MTNQFETAGALAATERANAEGDIAIAAPFRPKQSDTAVNPAGEGSFLEKMQHEAINLGNGAVNFGKAIFTNPTGTEAGIALVAGTAIVGSVLSYRSRLTSLAAKEAGALLPGMQMTRMFTSEGLAREYSVYVPTSLKTLAKGETSPVLVALDGLTVRNKLGSMGNINGINALAEKEGFIAAYPVPRTRLFGQISSWNPGLLNARAGYSDAKYLTGVLDDLGKTGLPIDQSRIYAATFSEAAIPMNAAARESGRFAGVANVSGTMLKSDLPAVGVKQNIVIRGELDPTLPALGGAGPNSAILQRLGHTNIAQSEPAQHALRIAEANGFKGAPQIIRHPEGVVETVYPAAQTATGAEVREYVIKAPFGGHTWHGRGMGLGTESAVSGRNGPLTPPSVFDANAKIAEIFRLGKPIARDLRPS